MNKLKLIILTFLLATIPFISTNQKYGASSDDNLIDLKNSTYESFDLWIKISVE